jgi:hypothetical protein
MAKIDFLILMSSPSPLRLPSKQEVDRRGYGDVIGRDREGLLQTIRFENPSGRNACLSDVGGWYDPGIARQ